MGRSIFLSLLAFTPVKLLGFARRARRRSVEPADAGSNAVGEPHEHEPGRRVQALVEELPGEQTEEHAQDELESYGAVPADAFPVLLHCFPRGGAPT